MLGKRISMELMGLIGEENVSQTAVDGICSIFKGPPNLHGYNHYLVFIFFSESARSSTRRDMGGTTIIVLHGQKESWNSYTCMSYFIRVL